MSLDQSPTTPPSGRTLSEIFPTRLADASGVGFMMAGLRGSAPLLWVQDRLSRHETGRPYLPGLSGRALIRLDVNRAVDVLWAMEEGLRCASLGAVIGEIWGDGKALDFVASKRLMIRAERYGMACWLIRHAASPDLSAARDRWRVCALPSRPHPDDPQAPGDPRWQVELFRSRSRRPGTWIATHDRAADRVDLAAAFRDGAVAEGSGAGPRRAAR